MPKDIVIDEFHLTHFCHPRSRVRRVSRDPTIVAERIVSYTAEAGDPGGVPPIPVPSQNQVGRVAVKEFGVLAERR